MNGRARRGGQSRRLNWLRRVQHPGDKVVARCVQLQVGGGAKCPLQTLLEPVAADLMNAELAQMIIGELRVEKLEAAGTKPCHQMNKRHFRSVSWRENIDSPKKAARRDTPYSPPTSVSSRHTSIECAKPRR